MGEEEEKESKEVTLDGELRSQIKELVTGLEIAQNIVLSLVGAKDRERSSAFYKALRENLQRAQEYVVFSTTDYLRENSPKP